MASQNRFTYERQARFGVILAALGGLGVLGAILLLWRNFAWQTFWVTYNPKGKWIIALGLCLLTGLVASGVGLLLGFNSAGQRRNTRSRLSWTGFFLNAVVITLALCAGMFFYFARYAIPTK